MQYLHVSRRRRRLLRGNEVRLDGFSNYMRYLAGLPSTFTLPLKSQSSIQSKLVGQGKEDGKEY